MNIENLNFLVKMYSGSHAYGTSLPTSDVDFRGIFCADPISIRTPFFPVREVADIKEEDTKFYELAHFMKLCLDCNPNIIELLWTDDEDIVFRTPAYDHIRSHRHALLSSKIAFTTSGYALAQLKKIKGHNKWINQPQPENPPEPRDFVRMIQYFGQDKTFKFNPHVWNKHHRFIPYGGNIYGVYFARGYCLFDEKGGLNSNFEGDRSHLDVPLFIVRFDKDQYRAAKEKHSQYWTWKNNRNKQRAILEENHGFDTKHAMHLVRLLRMGVEALRDEVIVVKRPDAEELLAIRDGAWTYEKIIKFAEQQDEVIRNVWYKKTKLPKKAPIKDAARILMDVQDMVWSNKKTQ